jgi:hydroxymethylbilane synthase
MGMNSQNFEQKRADSSKILRVGSRDSVLAVRQTRLVTDALARAYPGLAIELVTMKTSGDLNLQSFDRCALPDKGGVKGLFVKELEWALLDGRIDLAVHSLKDMPMEQDKRLPVLAFFERGDPRDALALPLRTEERGEQREKTEGKKTVGCSSARRRVQLEKLMPGWSVSPIRGNVLTRLKKLDEGQFSSLVLAASGLKRLGLESRISRIFEPEEMIPAAGQGILVCQGRADGELLGLLGAVNDSDSSDCAAAERAFAARLGGGCSLPVAAYARVQGTELILTGFYVDETVSIYRTGSLAGDRKNAAMLGEALAARLLEGKNGG